MDQIEVLIEQIQDAGLRVTPQRLAIIEVLSKSYDHPSAHEILYKVRKKFPSTSYSTVYSTLNALHELGQVRKLTIDPNCTRFDPNTSVHQHMICRKCGKIIDVPRDYLANFQVPAELRRKFDIEDYHVEFRGVCSECRGPVGPAGKKRGPKPKDGTKRAQK